MTEWQDISTAPKDGTLMQCWVECPEKYQFGWWEPKCRFIDGQWQSKHSHGWFDLNLVSEITGVKTPTHWMPLPNPPEAP